jgi:hypothetical protein
LDFPLVCLTLEHSSISQLIIGSSTMKIWLSVCFLYANFYSKISMCDIVYIVMSLGQY